MGMPQCSGVYMGKMKGLIWWVWKPWPEIDDNDYCYDYDVRLAWELALPPDDLKPDIYWLGECAWTSMEDNMNLGLRSV